METRYKLSSWQPDSLNGGWFRSSDDGTCIASVNFDAGRWYAAAEHPSGKSGALLPSQPSDDLARSAADEKLREYGWELG